MTKATRRIKKLKETVSFGETEAGFGQVVYRCHQAAATNLNGKTMQSILDYQQELFCRW